MTFCIKRSQEIWHRDDFALLCEWRRLYRVVEVGVDKGVFADCFLKRSWNCDLYLGIDPYLSYSEMPWDREGDFLAASQVFNKYPRAKLIRGDSVQVSDNIKAINDAIYYSRLYDFIYIDASHHRDAVMSNLIDWWPLLSDIGIIAGHDWLTKSGDHIGVQEAVIEFAKQRELTVYTTPDDPQSWYIYKHGIPGLNWRRC